MTPHLRRLPRPVFVHLNTNSVRQRLDELRDLVRGVSVVSLQETRIRDADTLSELFPAHTVYSFEHDAEGTGLALLVLSHLP